MTLLVDAVSLLSPLTGIGRYTYEISRRLMEQEAISLFFHYGYRSRTLYGPTTNPQGAERRAKTMQAWLKQNPMLKRAGRHFFTFLSRFSPHRYDLYWQPNFIPNPYIKAGKIVCTVHDFSFKLQPQWHTRELVDYYRKTFFSRIRTVDHIITGSDFTRGEIETYLRFPPERIRVIPHGVDRARFHPADSATLDTTRKALGLPEQFILFVGSIEPRKNLAGLLAAYAMLSPEEKHTFPLLLAGFRGWENRDIMGAISRDAAHIRYLGFVTETQLAHLYAMATLFVYPTLYEGFGLPPLEAMACGAPVIVSDVASLPEVCGDAALYCDPADPQTLRSAMRQIIHDPVLQHTMRRRSLERAALFSWERAAAAHRALFDELTG